MTLWNLVNPGYGPIALNEGGGVFEPGRNLFQPGDILLDYDPADLTTMFKDVAGTQPVTADGDSIALHLDKGQWGGRTLAQEMAVQTELRGSGAPGLLGTAAAASYDVLTGVGQATRVDVSNQSFVGIGVTASRLYAIDVESVSGGALAVRDSGPAGTILFSINGTRLTRYIQMSSAGLFFAAAGAATVGYIVHSLKLVPGYHRTQATGTSQRKYKTDGTLHWSLYDGTDDSDSTPTINWGTDKAAICAGLTKSSDAAIGVFFEFSPTANTNDGSFKALAPSGVALATLEGSARGTAVNAVAQSAIISGLAAPITAVATTLHDIAVDLTRLRINGGAWTDAVGDKGSGNFGNYALYFGRRGGTSFPFNGREYRTVMRNRLWSASEQSRLEAFIAAKSGVTL